MNLTPIPRVVDLSHYDNVTDKFAGAVQFGIWGVINKVTEGTGAVDASFGWRRKPAADAGLLYGAYHFLHPGRIDEQMTWFLQHVGDPTGLLLALDHEAENGARASVSDVKTACQIIHDKLGRWPWLYSGNDIKEQLGNATDPFWKNIKFWLAQYGAAPIVPPAFTGNPLLWQYTGDGSGQGPHNVPGILIGGRGIDINHWGGTRDELAAVWAS